MATTLEELAAALKTAADESAKTNAKIDDEIVPRLDHLDTQIKEAGLNGHTALLRQFLDDYAAGQSKEQAWRVVRADLARRFTWLASPKGWVRALFYAVLGGLGWKLVSGIEIPTHLFGH